VNLRGMNNVEFHLEFEKAARTNQSSAIVVLHFINDCERRKSYLDLGYSSVWDYCVRKLKYSSSTAARYIQAARCILKHPEMLPMLEVRELSISTICLIASSLDEELTSKVDSVNGVLRIDLETANVRCSEVLLRQVLWNIGENAVKYRRPDTQLEIRIQGRKFGLSYEFRMSDNGAGMSAEDAAHAFDPFFRASAVRSTPGTGLGLSIVKRVVEASGGHASVTSELGKGTTFVIALPLVQNEADTRWVQEQKPAV